MLRISGRSTNRKDHFSGWTIIAACLLLVAGPAQATSVAKRKHIALDQYHRALQMREALNGQPKDERTSDDYERVIEAFRKVYHVAPTSTRADASVLTVAELLAEQARLSDDEKGFEAAIGQYEFLCREYPGSKYRFEALLSIGQVYREDLDDRDSAKASFDDFLKRYPHHPLAENARAALKEMEEETTASNKNKNQVASSKQRENSRQAARGTPTPDDEDSHPIAVRTAAKHKGLPLVTSVRYWSTPDYTRIAIDLEDEVKYEAGRVPSPDRIFFDLHDSRLASELMGKSYDIDDGLLRKVRVAQYKPDVARVVLELDSLAEYSAFLLPNPYRLIIDLRGRGTTKQIQTAEAQSSATDSHSNSSTGVPQDSPMKRSATTKSVATADSASRSRSEDSQSDRSVIAKSKTPVLPPRAEVPIQTSDLGLAEIAALSDDPQEIKATSKPTSGPIVETVAKVDSKKTSQSDQTTSTSPSTTPSSRHKKQSQKASAAAPAVHEAAPTAEGDLSLVRALGLKIGKIVVDAGHGGHDTGTIGPNGLLEKDLVLDVALRLGKLLEQKLGADVVYTRQDDTFIPLETRTAIANQNQADLFISIHANSSPDPSARGVETYYLNFTHSADALEVAARENAVSETSVHDLQDLVKKIALKDKIDESREFAGTVQTALYTGESSKNPGVKNRGVKKAPFIVLIGANMPSILAEISFVSNPTDERKLRTPEYRQRIAESLYRGIARYAQGLSGIKVASAKQAVTTGQ
jgi:N-acetylmuramoyl-L-alanine amidase